ncbi:MAG TPA: antitoxin [Microlunatus sp.]|nr:antitoxin [Microlunatus sp.]
MGIFDKAKDMVGEHNAEVDKAIDQVADLADQKTGGKYTGQIDQAAEEVKEQLDRQHEQAADPNPPA